MKCQFCKKNEAVLTFEIMEVCSNCFDKLMQRKIQKQNERKKKTN